MQHYLVCIQKDDDPFDLYVQFLFLYNRLQRCFFGKYPKYTRKTSYNKVTNFWKQKSGTDPNVIDIKKHRRPKENVFSSSATNNITTEDAKKCSSGLQQSDMIDLNKPSTKTMNTLSFGPPHTIDSKYKQASNPIR